MEVRRALRACLETPIFAHFFVGIVLACSCMSRYTALLRALPPRTETKLVVSKQALRYDWCIWLFLLLAVDLSAAIPLINSPYARQNPGKIPYSSCTFETFPIGHFALFIGGGLGRDLVMLNCYSEKEQILSRIPLRLAPTFRAGLGIGFAGGGSIGITVHGLHGKTVGQLLGTYKGVDFLGVSFVFFGTEMQKYQNSHGIVLKGSSLTGGLDLNIASYGRLNFDICRKTKCMQPLRMDPAVLYAKTVYAYSGETYLVAEGQDQNRRQVSLLTNDKPFRLSEGGSLCWNDLNFRNPHLISPGGHTFHLVKTYRGMSDRMVILEENGQLAFQTLNGTGIFRLAEEVMPDVKALSELIFIEDGQFDADLEEGDAV